jgi:transcriptional regulator with XRE-family HTH domain
MSTKSSLNSIKAEFDQIFNFSTEKDEIEHDAQMLMYSFLSEVEKYQKMQGITRKTLADKIKTSASYITQLFRGSKPLNFEAIAKMQKALGIKFDISAKPVSNEMYVEEVAFEDTFINTMKFKINDGSGYWCYRNMNNGNREDLYKSGGDENLITEVSINYDSEAILA